MPEFAAKGLDSYQGEWDDVQKRHLLNRVMFGYTREDLAYFALHTPVEMVSELISSSPEPGKPLNFYEKIYPDPHGIREGETWINAPFGDGNINTRRKQSLKLWWTQNLWFQQRTIEEKMMLFWHNHFAAELETYNAAQMGYRYLTTLRKYALGNFRAFVKAITLEPAMLNYLNGQHNSKKSPDENYARELQELFMVGKGPDSGYTEEDVRQAARILTGHKYRNSTWQHYFNAEDHDTGDKPFSSFYNHYIIRGRSGQAGQEELGDLIEMILETDEVSRFIVRKLYRFFIYYEISDTTEEAFIRPLARIFKEADYEIKPLLQAFFLSEHFFDPAFYGAMIMSPLDFHLKTVKRLEVKLPDAGTHLYENYALTEYLRGSTEECHQSAGDPPGVAGWPAYYQAPVYHQAWINSDTLQKRVAFTSGLISNRFYRNGFWLQADLPAFTESLENPSDPDLLISGLCDWLLETGLSAGIRENLKTEILLSGQSSDYYWTELWEKYLEDRESDIYRNMVLDRLRKLYTYILSLPEYHLS